MVSENALKRRCKQTLYMIYSEYLEEGLKERFDEICELDPYLNQIIEEVCRYVMYDLPLREFIMNAIHGDKYVEGRTFN